MFPDLAGLSQEEAALITDVLSRLSIGSAPTASAVPQNTPAGGVLQDPALLELDLAAWTIEQELRGLHGASTLGSQHEHVQRVAYSSANPPFQGAEVRRAPLQPDGTYSTPQEPRLHAMNAARGPWDQAAGPTAQPPAPDPIDYRPAFQRSRQPNGLGTLQHAQHEDTPYVTAVTASQGGGLGFEGLPPPETQPLLRTGTSALATRTEERSANGLGSPTSTAPAPPAMSLLREMREKLRQQQQQHNQMQATTEVPWEAAPSRESSMNGSKASVGASKSSPVAHNGDASQAASPPSGVTSPASTLRPRRPPPSAPPSTAKAFTMLNARTSIERYGPQPGVGEAPALTPTKVPVKLPEPERSARLQQLYERTSKWRRRCAERYAKERHDREVSELEECTFTPKITTASHLIMQGKSPSEVYQALSKGSTPTKHRRVAGDDEGRPTPNGSSPARPGNVPAAVAMAASTGPSGMANTDGRAGTHTIGHVSGTAGSGPAGSTGSNANVGTANVSPPRQAVNGAEIGERMYHRAFEQRARQEARFFRQLLEEERQRQFIASVQGVSPRVYDPPEPPSSRYLPTGLEECTFHPNSFASGFNSRPKSAPHLRGGDRGGRHRTLTSPLFHIYGPPGVSGRGHGLSQSQSRSRTFGIHTTVSISPDLDWEEFLARQERFLAMREHKIQLLEQNEPAVPRMSPGSKKLLREREVRQSTVGADGTGLQAEPSARTASSSPGRQDRRVKTIMDMYKECTFQPQITRRAAALPSRQVDDFVDGGRARREEWRQQQLALQQVREAENLTFKPQIFTKDAYSHVRPRISLKNPDAYLAHVADKRRQREALRAELDSEREALELQKCTFKPQTTPLPAYLIRRLQEQHLQHLQAEQQLGQSISWEESSGGLGDIDCELVKGPDSFYADRERELQRDYQPYHGYQAATHSPEDKEMEDALEPEMGTFQQAYQRALQYANSLPVEDG